MILGGLDFNSKPIKSLEILNVK